MKIERLYSDYQEEERLYSTGNDELDDLLEIAFCDGYEYAQKEFTGEVKRRNKELKKQWEAAQGKPIKRQRHIFNVYDANELAETDIKLEKAGGTNRGGGMFGRKTGERVESSDIFGVNIPKDKASTWKDIPVEEDAINRRKYRNAREYNRNHDINNVHDSINNRVRSKFFKLTDFDRKKLSSETEGEFKKRFNEVQKAVNEDSIEINKRLLRDHPEYLESLKENAEKRAKNKSREKLKRKLGKGKKAALIGVPVAAAAIGTGIAIKKHHDKKKKEQEEEK